MTIILSEVTFENDFFSVDLPDGSVLILNKVEESLLTEEGVVIINAINLQITKNPSTNEEEYISCPCVIGMNNDILGINTDYTEYEGQVLTPENIGYCTIEVYE